jgi:hypothetical protein
MGWLFLNCAAYSRIFGLSPGLVEAAQESRVNIHCDLSLPKGIEGGPMETDAMTPK